MYIYAVKRNLDSTWLRSKGRSGYGEKWVHDFERAKIYGKESTAKAQCTYYSRRGIICSIIKFKLVEIPPYNVDLPSYGELIDVKTFSADCCDYSLIDYDGHGHPVKDNKMSNQIIKPSKFVEIPEDATHIMWFNK